MLPPEELKAFETCELRELFRHIIILNSVDNDDIAHLYFYSLLGAMLKDVRIIKGGDTKLDLRIPILWIQQSRTGKGVLNKTFQKLAQNLGLKTTTTTEVTTAGMVGSIDQDALEYNMKFGLTPENPLFQRYIKGKPQEFHYQDPVIKGDLGNYDIIIIDEAKILLEPTRHTEQLLTVLQPVLDCPGWVRKKLASKHSIEYLCSPTIIATTYFFSSIKSVLANQGFFQRMAFYIRDLSGDEILEMRNHASQIATKESIERHKILSDLFIKRMNNEVNRSAKDLIIHPEALDWLKGAREHFFKEIQANLSGSELSAAYSFSNTFEELTLKIAGQYTILRGLNEITLNHIYISYPFVRGIVSTILNKIEVEEDREKAKETNEILLLYKSLPQPVSKMGFYTTLHQRRNYGMNKCQKLIDKLIQENYLYEEKGEKNTKFLKLR